MSEKGFVKDLTRIALKALIKSSNVDMRLHGEENIPEQPTMFVVNHFTRIETFFLPYLINSINRKDVKILAYNKLFTGNFGKYLSRMGAVSTKDPRRNIKFIGSLLEGKASCLIFPEGQMIKDKKLVEHSKYLIYNAGIRRSPHTGAAYLSVLSEFYRQKLRHLHTLKKHEAIRELYEYFELDQSMDPETIINQETYIVPVNLTYFPIRARNNIINRIVHRFVHDIPDNVEEELEVEGAMILDGVDIDINFGVPVSVKQYLLSSRLERIIKNEDLYLGDKIKIPGMLLRKRVIDLMFEYMRRIYAMTTVNHDHIFACMLRSYKKPVIGIQDLKNRSYVAINEIRELDMQTYHTSLKKHQGHLLTADEHANFNSFIEAAKSEGLIKVNADRIFRNSDRFSQPYKFHSIRKDNIVEVLENEIEPLVDVKRIIKNVSRMSSWKVQRKIRERFVKYDMELFYEDYGRYQIRGESKEKNIGMPFFYHKQGARCGVLLVHGYMAAPEEVKNMGKYFYKKGYTVYGVRLRGHGTSPEDLADRQWEEWYESVNRGYVILKNSVKKIAAVGFSTGAGLALYQAALKSNIFRTVVSINAPLRLNNIASQLASSMVLWNRFLDRMHIHRGKMEFIRNVPENPHINYFRNPISGVKELGELMSRVETSLPDLKIPALIIQGNHDPVVNPVSGKEIFDKLGSIEKEYYPVESDRHGIVNGNSSMEVFKKAEQFIRNAFK